MGDYTSLVELIQFNNSTDVEDLLKFYYFLFIDWMSAEFKKTFFEFGLTCYESKEGEELV